MNSTGGMNELDNEFVECTIGNQEHGNVPEKTMLANNTRNEYKEAYISFLRLVVIIARIH